MEDFYLLFLQKKKKKATLVNDVEAWAKTRNVGEKVKVIEKWTNGALRDIVLK